MTSDWLREAGWVESLWPRQCGTVGVGAAEAHADASARTTSEVAPELARETRLITRMTSATSRRCVHQQRSEWVPRDGRWRRRHLALAFCDEE